ncbi:helix-turn-helix domain-containing protein [Leptospira sp. 'Mane']|uniref:helix-turn-helix domain-containing protein n=1 Tax=Leptospira sp. 'Mane' TaxID=3387407 RepID=UPI00398B65B0
MDLKEAIGFLWLGSGGIFCIVWSISFLVKLEEPPSLRFRWAFVLFSTGLWLISGAFFFSKLYVLFPGITLFHIPFVLASAPILYEYFVLLVLDKKPKLSILLYLPAVFSIVLLFPFYFKSAEEQILFFSSPPSNVYQFAILSLNLMIKLGILFSAGLFLFRYIFPFVSWGMFLKKGGRLTLVFFFLVCLDLLVGTSGFLFKISFLRELSAFLLPFLMFFYFIAREIWKPFIFHVKEEIKRSKYEKSKLVNLDLESIKNEIHRLMLEERIYCDEDLNLTRFAELVQIRPQQMSELLNIHFGKSFFHFINDYRVAEAKKILIEDPKRSILSIADSVGFNSKSTFNRAFLEKEGKTPTEFKEKSAKEFSRSKRKVS